MNVYCSIHSSRPAVYYCLDHQLLLCEDQSHKEHAKHEFIFKNEYTHYLNLAKQYTKLDCLRKSLLQAKLQIIGAIECALYSLTLQMPQFTSLVANQIKNHILKTNETPHNNESNLFSIKIIECINYIKSFTNFDAHIHPPKQILETPIIHYWIGSEITIFNPINQQKSIISLNQIINFNAESISYGKKIFIIGGNLTADVNEVNIGSQILVAQQPMIIKKYAHSLCNSIGYIYAIGGTTDNNSSLDECEKYDVISNKWNYFPKLLAVRCKCAAFIFNNEALYACCGENGVNNLNTIEKITINGNNQWESISVGKSLSARRSICGIQLNNKQAIIFGGFDSNPIRQSIILDVTEKGIKASKMMDMVCDACFIRSSAPAFVGGNLYSVDVDRRIHKFNGKKWEIIA